MHKERRDLGNTYSHTHTHAYTYTQTQTKTHTHTHFSSSKSSNNINIISLSLSLSLSFSLSLCHELPNNGRNKGIERGCRELPLGTTRWRRWGVQPIKRVYSSFCPCSVLLYRSHPLDSNIGDNIPSHLAKAVDYNFSDSSSGAGSNISHFTGDNNIRLRPKEILHNSIAGWPALRNNIQSFISLIINIM